MNLYAPDETDTTRGISLGARQMPGLIALALLLRSRDGPRFVFHYPPHPSTQSSNREVQYGTELDQSEHNEVVKIQDSSDNSDVEDVVSEANGSTSNLDLPEPRNGDIHDMDLADGCRDNHYDGPNGEQVVPWEHLGEFSAKDLESILTPSRAFHKKRFELSLDPLHFVSYPMHIREDGLWKKKKRDKIKKPKKDGSDTGSRSGGELSDDKRKANSPAPAYEDSGGMTMFNVVFILNVPREDEDERIYEVYSHVIKKFNKALKHAQAQSNYVWKEAEMMLSMKDKAREERRPMSWLWNQILLKSSLAGAIVDVFKAISNDRIATVRLKTTPTIDLSLQIPVPLYQNTLPSANERAMPGLLLTTANPNIDEEGNEDPTYLNKHFALLLLDDQEKTITEIREEDTELSNPLIECIKISKPTHCFQQVFQSSPYDLNSILTLAQHLIYWRKAVAIPPLHARDTYIISPKANMLNLPAESVAWSKAFPLAPSLPNFLSLLSAAPRAYKSYSPSRDHRQTYMEMLSWLVRGGWVTQLRTFAWIVVWPELIYEVEYQLKAEALEAAKSKAAASSSPSSSSLGDSRTNSTEPTTPSADSSPEKSFSKPLTTEEAAENARLQRLAAKAAEEALADAQEFAKRPRPVATSHPSSNNAAHLKHLSPHIIIDPHKVGHTESLYIAALGKRFSDSKVRECWGRFARYFNGREALEGVALRENMKRKETWMMLMNFQEFFITCRHW